jgi:nitrilase
MTGHRFVAAAIQGSPEFLDLPGTLEKVDFLIRESARQGATLIVFPEAFISGFPYWIWGDTASPETAGYEQVWRSAIDVPGVETERIGEAARNAGAVVVVGVNERDSSYGRATLYNTMLTFDADGSLVRRHRKTVPTYKERTIWGAGDGSGLPVANTAVGPLGGLICWENFLPLARFHQYAQGIQVHIAPTLDESSQWIDLMRTIGAEGRIYAVSACQFLDPGLIGSHPLLVGLPKTASAGLPGSSVIVDPHGTVIAGPSPEKDASLTAEIDPLEIVRARHSLDVTGHSFRSDLFHLTVDTRPRSPFTVQGKSGAD